ncbi:hypothetical protein EWM64_g7125 [Hericium alpestre]|uniref:SET domain-containing protein n=1 Tax=Hericium alpestre TaxID=135208 RepID=A0A4Y9ZPQ8_9AGAM|nr:hypothetical protein EWM64_g7125 [Hericium alpestre]
MPVTGAGLGMYTTHPIGAGEVVFAEHALLIMSQSTIIVSASQKVRGTREDAVKRQAKYCEELMMMLLDRLSPENAVVYCTLVNLHMDDGYGYLAGIFEMNSWQIPTTEMRKAISGHLDSPFVNIGVTYIHTEKVAHILAVQHQEHLSSYGFTCTCMACCSPAISDPHHAELVASQVMSFPKFHQWLENLSVPVDYYIKESKHILRLIADEGLEGGQAYLHHLEHFLIAYAALRQGQVP